MATTSHLGITLVDQSQSQKEVTVNAALIRIDALLNNGAKSRTTATPPGSPVQGDLYIVGASPTGDWTGQAKIIAYFDQVWRFITPVNGMTVWVIDEVSFYYYNGTDWAPVFSKQTISDQPTNYTLVGTDSSRVIRFTSASAVVLTLPNSLPAGFYCNVIQAGAGQITFTPAGGANRRNRQSHTKSAGQWAVCNLQVNANSGGSAAEYVLSGDTAA